MAAADTAIVTRAASRERKVPRWGVIEMKAPI